MSEILDSQPHFILHHLDLLSVWEVSHRYWSCNPDETNPKRLPLNVQDLIREILLSNGFNFYDEAGNEFLDVHIAFGIIFQRLNKIRMQVSNRLFRKPLLDRLFVEKDDFAKWIIERRNYVGTDIKLPGFWYSQYDIEYFEEEYGKKHFAPDTASDNKTALEESQQTRAALTRHEPTYKIKQDYIRFWLKVGYEPRQKKEAATAFYNALSPEAKRLIAPSAITRNAIRTLNQGLHAYLNEEFPPPPFLDGFVP